MKNVRYTWFCDLATSEDSRPLTTPTADVASLPSCDDVIDDVTLLAGEWNWLSTSWSSQWSWSRAETASDGGSGSARVIVVVVVDFSLRSIGSASVTIGNDIDAIDVWCRGRARTDADIESICLPHQQQTWYCNVMWKKNGKAQNFCLKIARRWVRGKVVSFEVTFEGDKWWWDSESESDSSSYNIIIINTILWFQDSGAAQEKAGRPKSVLISKLSRQRLSVCIISICRATKIHDTNFARLNST